MSYPPFLEKAQTFQMNQIFAPGQQTVTVQSSTDLITWTDLTTLNTTFGTATFVDPIAGLAPDKFYRLKQ